MASRTIVGSPLTPGLLEDLGALGEIPPAPTSFAPDGDWVNTYRVWTCHGYRESGNDDEGFLKIERVGQGRDGRFRLNVDQQIVHTEAALNAIHAELECKTDPIASLVRWRLSSRFVGPEGEVRPRLGTEERGRVRGEGIEVSMNGRTFTRDGSSRLTADWCLFEAVQRLKFEEGQPLAFDMLDLLEGLSLLRRGHRLSYRGVESATFGSGIPLHGFHQLGHGTLPYEYWLDDQHRLVIVVTHSRVYVLDEKAEEKTAAMLEASRHDYEQKRKEREGGERR